MERILTLIFALFFLIGPAAWANPTAVTPSGIELERFADESITPPGIEGTLVIDMPPPIVCNGGALFHATGSLVIRSGVYLAPAPGELTVIANPGVPVPGSPGKTFQEAGNPVCVGRQVVFLGDDDITPSSTGRSVYTWNDGVITLLLEQGTMIGSDTVLSFNRLTANEFGVAVVSRLRYSTQGIVVMPYGAAPNIIADNVTTILPGQTTAASGYGTPFLVGSDLFFTAGTQQDRGIYKWSQDRGISLVVDTNTPVPVPPGGSFYIFDGFFAPLREGLVFGATYTGGLGLFIWDGFEVRPFIVPGDVTDAGETFVQTLLPSGEGSLLTFYGRTAENLSQAIYVRTYDGRILRVLGIGEIFEGGQIDFITAHADRTTLAVRVSIYGGSIADEAIYRVAFANPLDVPGLSPAGMAALVLALTFAGLWVLRSTARSQQKCSSARSDVTRTSDMAG